MLRSLKQAMYSPDNVGHFGLAYEHYTHFTSPIRRYPDLLVHRAIKAVLASEVYTPHLSWEDIGLHCSGTERRADEATRDVENWLKCYFMKERIGEEFDGTISAVTGFGIFVALDEIYVEGLVHVSDLGEDYFQFDNIKHQMLGERTGKRYRLGDRVRVKLVRANLEQNKIDFTLVRGANADTGQKPVGRSTLKPQARNARFDHSDSRDQPVGRSGQAKPSGKPEGKPAGKKSTGKVKSKSKPAAKPATKRPAKSVVKPVGMKSAGKKAAKKR
jgi:ribonuclease R